jgi:alkane 1-monooxygenase
MTIGRQLRRWSSTAPAGTLPPRPKNKETSVNHAPSAALPAPPYRDRKRYAWLLSILAPSFVGSGPLLVHFSGQPAWAWAPVVFLYVLVPLLDLLLGEDRSNPPESAVPALEADRYYRRVTYATVPVLWAAFIGAVWYLATQPLPLHAQIAMVLSAGLIGGFGINLGHELGHKTTTLERWLAKIVLAPTGYGHFFIEHNHGHHRDVATPEDPASSRMGETIYSFVLREMPGALKRAWAIEVQRLRQRALPVWSLHNEILQPALITLVLWAVLVAWLGWVALPFILAVSFWANFQLTSANYIEHYGLLRARLPSGRYEPCRPHHSWNSNHLCSNWIVFHLQRHSDHHAHPMRRYQSLRHFDGLPTLPNGYMGVFLVAYLPPLWFRLMDRRLVQAVGGEASRIHFQPGKREALVQRHGLRLQEQAA